MAATAERGTEITEETAETATLETLGEIQTRQSIQLRL